MNLSALALLATVSAAASAHPLPAPLEQARVAALPLGRTCRTNPNRVGPCFATRGRIRVYNGSLIFRLWRIGTKRLVAIVPDEDPIMPEAVKQEIEFSADVFGNFVLCPFTAEAPGVMQLACIASASDVRVVEYRDAGAPRMRTLAGEFHVDDE